MPPSATPATQSATASLATKGSQERQQGQSSAISATLARQNEGGCCQRVRDKDVRGRCVWQMCVCVRVCERWCVTRMCVCVCGRWCVRVWQSCVWKTCVTNMCVYVKDMCDKVVCARWCVTKLRVCVWQRWVWQNCVLKMVCDKDVGDSLKCL